MKYKILICSLALIAMSSVAAYSGYTQLYNGFSGTNVPKYPLDYSIAAGTIYGTTATNIFQYNVSANAYTSIYTSASGSISGNIIYYDKTPGFERIYGITSNGGSTGKGTVFSVNTSGREYAAFDFNREAIYTPSKQIIISGDRIIGTAEDDNTPNSYGGIWSKKFNSNSLTVLKQFDAASGYDCGGLVLAQDGYLYGMNARGGINGGGTIFKIMPDGTNFSVLYSFSSSGGPRAPLGLLYIDGAYLYGMTSESSTGFGTVFKFNTTNSALTILHTFTGGTQGATPKGSITLVAEYLYGVTSAGGNNSGGIIFKVGVNGTNFAKLYDFNGKIPNYERLVFDNGTFYGAVSNPSDNGGVIYSFVEDDPLAINLPAQGICLGRTNITLAPLGEYVSGGTGPYTYLWSPAAGLDDATKKNPVLASTPANSITYTVTVTDASGVIGTGSLLINPSTLSISGPASYTYPYGSTFYLGNFITANGTAPYTADWLGPNGDMGTFNLPAANPGIMSSNVEIYRVIVKDAAGCQCEGYYRLWPR